MRWIISYFCRRVPGEYKGETYRSASAKIHGDNAKRQCQLYYDKHLNSGPEGRLTFGPIARHFRARASLLGLLLHH